MAWSGRTGQTRVHGTYGRTAAVITGASGGIGWATAKRYVAEGAAVIAADIDDERGAEMVADIGGAVTYGMRCHRSRSGAAAVDRCVRDHGRIDVIFNNAATSTGGYVADLDLDGFDASLSVMLKGPLHGMQAALPHMVEQEAGRSSRPRRCTALQLALQRPVLHGEGRLDQPHSHRAIEYGRKGVRANCICPGVVETPMFEQVLGIGLITREQVSDMAALGRTIRPEEIADLALFLGSDDSASPARPS